MLQNEFEFYFEKNSRRKDNQGSIFRKLIKVLNSIDFVPSGGMTGFGCIKCYEI